ncbi:MAG: hypothetical protein AB7G06_05660 [Bdellovibrionales bacterium]
MKSVSVDRRIPVAFLAALLLQAGIAIWWASEQAMLLRFHQSRLQVIEAQQATAVRQENMLLVRLARIEERLVAQTQLLADIRTQLKK